MEPKNASALYLTYNVHTQMTMITECAAYQAYIEHDRASLRPYSAVHGVGVLAMLTPNPVLNDTCLSLTVGQLFQKWGWIAKRGT